jgi:prephenate dehydrogenase
MESWVRLENEMLSLKQQKVPIVFRPLAYAINQPIGGRFERIAYSNPNTLPDICAATEKVLDSLDCYLRQCLKLPKEALRPETRQLLEDQRRDVASVRTRGRTIQGRPQTHTT